MFSLDKHKKYFCSLSFTWISESLLLHSHLKTANTPVTYGSHDVHRASQNHYLTSASLVTMGMTSFSKRTKFSSDITLWLRIAWTNFRSDFAAKSCDWRSTLKLYLRNIALTSTMSFGVSSKKQLLIHIIVIDKRLHLNISCHNDTTYNEDGSAPKYVFTLRVRDEWSR